MSRKRLSRSSLVLSIFILGVSMLFLGCPKKTPPPQDAMEPSTEITTEIDTTPKLAEEGYIPAQKEAEKDYSQELAQRGEDIPLREVSPQQVFTEPSPEERRILRTIYFDFDKSAIKPEYREVLDRIGQWAKDNTGRQLLIEGHCDERGTNEYNLALGERRALAVRRYLVGLGVAPERLHTISYGEEKPADPGHSESAWALNRRAEFKVSVPE
jgi:peptidoglycan-associated lipoprotein